MLHYGRLHPATILSTFPASHILSSFRGGPPSPPPLSGPGVAQQGPPPPHHSVFGAMQVSLWSFSRFFSRKINTVIHFFYNTVLPIYTVPFKVENKYAISLFNAALHYMAIIILV